MRSFRNWSIFSTFIFELIFAPNLDFDQEEEETKETIELKILRVVFRYTSKLKLEVPTYSVP